MKKYNTIGVKNPGVGKGLHTCCNSNNSTFGRCAVPQNDELCLGNNNNNNNATTSTKNRLCSKTYDGIFREGYPTNIAEVSMRQHQVSVLPTEKSSIV